MSTFQPKGKVGLGALIKESKALTVKDKPEAQVEVKFVPPEQAIDRIRLIFDDSISMSGAKITDAQEGTIEFMRSCTLNQTALAIHPMNRNWDDSLVMSTDLPALSVAVKSIDATGGTPLFETLRNAMDKEPRATQYIVFSDGEANNHDYMEHCISRAVEAKTPVDTVYIAYNKWEEDPGRLTLKELAERTGGVFIEFERGKTTFKKVLKYLAPSNRKQLAASVQMQEDLREGRI